MTQHSVTPATPEAAGATGPASVGLPAGVRACLFDLDGVLTRTAAVHAAAWKEMFDGYLHERAARTGEPFVAFDIGVDYNTWVDGKPRHEGTRSFLASRGITLPDGAPTDPPETESIFGLGNRKNALVVHKIRTEGVEVYSGSVQYLHAVRAAGLRTAVVSSSANTRDVLQVTGLTDLLEARVDAGVAVEEHLAGKPAPDTFLAGASKLGVEPAQAAVFEDALSGVAAGRAGNFAIVVGVDRVGQRDGLLQHGADIVVNDLAELLENAE